MRQHVDVTGDTILSSVLEVLRISNSKLVDEGRSTKVALR